MRALEEKSIMGSRRRTKFEVWDCLVLWPVGIAFPIDGNGVGGHEGKRLDQYQLHAGRTSRSLNRLRRISCGV